MPYRDLEPAIREIGHELQAHVRRSRGVRERAEQRLLELVIAAPAARARLFQLVDAFPALRDDEDVADHIEGYLDHEAVPVVVRHAVRLAQHLPGGERASAAVARRGITHMANRFIAGTDADSAGPAFERLWAARMGVIVDLLGEKTITAGDADRYAARLAALVAALTGATGRRSVAIKPTALAPRLHALTADDGLAEASARLAPVLAQAAEAQLPVWFDMEQYEVKDLVLELFRSLADHAGDTGIVIQAYLRDSLGDLAQLMEWSTTGSRPIAVRLVKGAYWDAETVLARARGWPVPVYERKGDTDANFERCTRLLLEHRAGARWTVQPAFASHNVRSVAHAIAVADDLGLPRRDLRVPDALRHGGRSGRCGSLPGTAGRCVRASGRSRPRHVVPGSPAAGELLQRELRPPDRPASRRGAPADRAGGLCPERGGGGMTDLPPYAPEPVRRWHESAVRAAFARAVDKQATDARDLDIPAVVGTQRISSEARLTSVDPGRIERVVATAASADAALADEAVAVAQRARGGLGRPTGRRACRGPRARRIVDARPPGRVGGAHGVRGRQAVARGRRRRL